MDNRLLKSEMVLYGDTMESLANYLLINRATLSRKISGEADFKQREMIMIRDRYKLTDEKFAQIFTKDGCKNPNSSYGLDCNAANFHLARR